MAGVIDAYRFSVNRIPPLDVPASFCYSVQSSGSLVERVAGITVYLAECVNAYLCERPIVTES